MIRLQANILYETPPVLFRSVVKRKKYRKTENRDKKKVMWKNIRSALTPVHFYFICEQLTPSMCSYLYTIREKNYLKFLRRKKSSHEKNMHKKFETKLTMLGE